MPTLYYQVPDGATPGSTVTVTHPTKGDYPIKLPVNVQPGMSLEVHIPVAPGDEIHIPNCTVIPEIVVNACPGYMQTLGCSCPGIGYLVYNRCLCCEVFNMCRLEHMQTCCLCHNQWCCIDNRCAIPPTPSVPCAYTCCPCCLLMPKVGCCQTIADITHNKERAQFDESAGVDPTMAYICDACFCCINSCYCKCPECIGSGFDDICCCCHSKGFCRLSKGFVCCMPVCCMPCFKCQWTNCCLTMTCAVPCDDDAPVALTCCFLSLCPKPGCCVKLKDLQATLHESREEASVNITDMTPVAQAPEAEAITERKNYKDETA